MELKRIFISGFFLLASSTLPVIMAQSNHWMEAKSINGNFKAVSSLPDLEVFSAPNTIMIKVNRDIEVRIFTILGKLISDEHLQPGIFQYHLEAHGIYIVKTEDSSCKIAI